ncbi:amidohydrolase family protein [Martelella alba]|uniref:Amidohydrolase family protein n=1 Tax=Martelella alba TaxID=2590451 RepID=A0A506UCG6_9HYPH|nr:amidohydrolase [Martelella alba]TPW30505.1 amidohydrolase family protein [Martelella alba]
MATDLVIDNLIGSDGAPTAIVVTGGVITGIGPNAAAGLANVVDGAGLLLLPGLVDGHIHLDKTLIGLPFIPHIPGDTVAKRIAAERELRRTVSLPVTARGGALIEQIAAMGTVAVRSHVDIDTEAKLSGLEAVLSLKQSHGHLIDIQTVAFPQSGIVRDPGTADLLNAAIEAGADLVGGLDPAGIDNDISGHLDAIFAIAGKHGIGIDLHLHDGGALGAFELRQIAERSIALGLQGKVAVSHAFCLGELATDDFARTAALLAKANVSIMTNGPGPVSMPPVKQLQAEGVRVFAGSDNIRDAWSPFGNGDLIERAGIICDRQDFRADEDLALALSLVTAASGAVLGRSEALAIGAPADFLLIRAGSVAEAVAGRSRERTVYKAGRKIAEAGQLI